MRINMSEWKRSVTGSGIRKAMPVMTCPGLDLIGKGIDEMVSDGEIQYKCLKVLSDRYDTAAASTMMMALYVEAEAFGSEIIYSKNEIPTVSGRLIKSLASLKTLRIPKVGDCKTSEHLLAARLATSHIMNHPFFGGIIGPFSLAGRLFDISEFMTAILTEPQGSHELLRICTGFLKEYAMAFKEAGSNGVIIAEPAAGLLSENECHEFSSRYVKEIVDYVQDDYFMVILHNCGNATNLTGTMVSTGAEGLHFGNAVDITRILPKVPADRLVFGNLDPVGIIKNGNPAAIKEKTYDLLDKTSDYRNFILSSGCDIPPGTKIENIDAIFEAVKEYNESLISTPMIAEPNALIARA